jgi:diaminopimelate decarboxylase
MAAEGWRISPILDSGELEAFTGPAAPRMDVGLRLKFGPVSTQSDLDGLISRFGMTLGELSATATAVDAAENLRFTTLHAMVGAAEVIPVERFVESLGVAGRIWAGLRRSHPTLEELNIGGGVPPLAEPYDHAGFLHGLFGVLAAAAANADVPAPKVTFELGSLMAAEAGLHIFKIIQVKDNDFAHEPARSWNIVDGGLMAAIPDMLFLDKSFRILAAREGHAEARAVRIGDITCDSDGRYPPKAFGSDAFVPLPAVPGDQYIAIAGVGAYQEILAGVRGAHHCGLLEAPELILENTPAGVRARLMPRQTYGEAAAVLGYTEDAAPALRAAGRTP